MEESNKKIVKGIRSSKGSIKILQIGDNAYIVEEKRYFGTFCYRKKIHRFNTLDDAEDKFLELRYSIRITRFPNFLN